MIPDIQEINFPTYATLTNATVTMSAMGERTIAAEVSIAGDIVPDFSYDWEIVFNGERYIQPLREPQACKDNSSQHSVISLTFVHWAIHEMKRYFFVEMTSTEAGTAIADKYVATLGVTLPDFVTAFNKVLSYYFDDKISMVLNTSVEYNAEPQYLEIDKSRIWDVLQNLYEVYAVRWTLAYAPQTDKYEIRVGFDNENSIDHVFEYGFEGGLLKVERSVQDEDITNILLGRGGDKNLPTWYFKNPELFFGGDNENFKPDPDAIPELRNVSFTALRGWTFRSYIRGWQTNPNRIQQTDSWSITALPTRDESLFESDWAYAKGCTDTKFDPPEYVKSETSIAKYGEKWGALDDIEEVYPSIQGVTQGAMGRIDEIIAVEEVVTDDISSMSTAVNNETLPDLGAWVNALAKSKTPDKLGYTTGVVEINSVTNEIVTFTVPAGKVANLDYKLVKGDVSHYQSDPGLVLDTEKSSVVVMDTRTGEEHIPVGIPAGTYRVKANVSIYNPSDSLCTVRIYMQNVKLSYSAADSGSWAPTFDIWIKNIWGTTKKENETEEDYVTRVWLPILGSSGEEATVTFSTGLLSGHEDWEFPVVGGLLNGVHFDQSKALNGVPSEWRLTLKKSDAELEAINLYIPYKGFNASAGDKFLFTGIDMPYDYVYWAEQRLDDYKKESLVEVSSITPTWNVALDKVRINTFDTTYGDLLVKAIIPGALIHVKDKRFTNDEPLNLFIETATYTWEEGTNLPNVEITLSETLYVTKSTREVIEGQISTLQQAYISLQHLEETVSAIVDKKYLSKTAKEDVSYTRTSFASPIQSVTFSQGREGGSGWGVYSDSNKSSTLEVDKVIVREKLDVNEVVINQTTFINGKHIISAAGIEVTRVEDTADGYKCYFDIKRGSVGNTFKVDDIAMGQRFDMDNTEVSFYKRLVVALGVDYIVLSKTDFSEGADTPDVGDVIVQFGNKKDKSRQGVHVISSYGDDAPSYTAYAEVDDFSITDKEVWGFDYRLIGDTTSREPFFFNYGSMLLGDKDKKVNYIEYDHASKKLKIKAEVEFEPTSTGLETTEAWQDMTERLDNMQDQVDGAIETWYVTGTPTLTNYPAEQWATENDKLRHVGDICYNDKGKGWRFMQQEDGTFFWLPLADEDLAKALKDAQEALEKANNAIKSVDIEYALGDSNTVPPTSGWSTTAPVRSDGKYLWQRTVTYTSGAPTYSDPVWISGIDGDNGDTPEVKNGTWWIGGEDTGIKAVGVDGNTPAIGSNGNWWIGGKDTGHQAVAEDGVGIESVEEWYAVSATQDGSAVGTWYQNAIPSGYGEAYPYLWNKEKIIYTNGKSSETVAAIIGVWGKDGAAGRGIVSIENVYQLGASPTEVPTGQWQSTPQTPTDEYPYLWNKELITYTDSTVPEETEPAIIGVKGNNGATPEIRDGYWYIGNEQIGKAEGTDGQTPHIGENGNWWIGDTDTKVPATGNGVKEIKEWYRATATQETPDSDTSQWTLGQIPSDFGKDKPYLWNYEEIIDTDGKIMSSVTVLIGVWGKDGKEITRVENYYAISASKDTAPSLNAFDTDFVAPTLDKPYLWNYEKVYYTEGEPSTTVPAIIGIMGATIVSITELYYLSSSATAPAAPTSEVTEKGKVLNAWTQTCPDFENGYTYFTCSQILRSDGVFTWSDVASSGDIKNHVYYTEEGAHPLPPYNVGDMWVCSHYVDTGAAAAISQAESENIVTDTDADGNVVVLADANTIEYKNEILVCINGKKPDETFSINDWQPAADYAHDSDYAYLKDALPETSSVVNGGLVLGSFIGVSDAEQGSVTDGNVVAGLCGVRGGNNEFYDTDKNSKLLLFAGAGVDDTPATKYKNAKTQIWDDGTFISRAGVLEEMTARTMRNPFAKVNDSFKVQATDMLYSGSLNTHLTATLDWTTKSSGRRLVLVGSFEINAPSGMYFWVNGNKTSTMETSFEVTEMLGYGTDTSFFGWIIINRTLFQTRRNFGREFTPVAFGRVVATSASATFKIVRETSNGGTKTESGTSLSIARVKKGVYELRAPMDWWASADYIYADLTGYGKNYDGNAPLKATLYSITEDTETNSYVLEIHTSDDASENDGSFMFKLYNMAQWDDFSV